MAFDLESGRDVLNQKIIAALQRDARLSMAELGRLVGLSAPAAAERVRKLESRGVITGYHAHVAPAATGRAVCAFIRIITTTRGHTQLVDAARKMPEVLECHHVAGDDSFILKVRVSDVAALEALISRINVYGETRTAIALSSPIERGALFEQAEA